MSSNVKSRRVRDIMVRDLVTIEKGDRVGDAIAMMGDHRVSALPVVDARNRCIGVLSTTDVLGLVKDRGDVEPDELMAIASSLEPREGDAWAAKPVEDVMTADVVSVSPEDTVNEAAQTLVRNRVHRLIVTDSNAHVVGIVSTVDLVQALSIE